MSNVIIDKSKIDILANAISVKSGEPVTMTLDEMVSAVDGIETGGGEPALETVTKTYTPGTSAVTDTITPSSGYDGIEEVDVTVSAVPLAEYLTGVDHEYYTENNVRKWHFRGKTELDTSEGDVEGWIGNGTQYGEYVVRNAIASGTSVTPTTSSQTIGGANTMMEGAVTINPIPSQYIIPTGNLPITQNGTGIDVTNYATVSVDVASSCGMSVASATATPSSASSSISFTNLDGEPTSFYVVSASDLATGASPYKVASVVYDGSSVFGHYITNTSNAQMTYSSTAFSKSFSNNTLTITASGANFQANQYKLVYTYGGNSANLGTAQVQVGSGVTSITFTGLTEEPTCWSCLFTDNIGTSSGYTRAHVVVFDGSSIYGMEMGSSSMATSNWTKSYNNGSLTITSTSTSAGGYFHQPGYYQLSYGIGGSVELTVEPLNVTQNGTYQESGKAYSPVTVSVSSGGSANIATATTTNSNNQSTSISFTLPSGRTPKAFFARLTSQIARNSNSRYYYVFDMRWDGSSTGGVAGNTFYMYNGTLTNVTSGYSYSQSGTTFTLSSTGSRSASPGSFYNGDYELVYIY